MSSSTTNFAVDDNLPSNRITINGQKVRLIRKLGEGNRGAVYLGEIDSDKKDGKPTQICVKKIKVDEAFKSEKKSQKEAQAVIDVYKHQTEVVTEKNSHYFTMPFFEGKMLDELINKGEMTLYQKVQIAELLKKEIEKVHKAGYLHRDLKPNNIIVNIIDGEVVGVHVLDLGRAVKLTAKTKALVGNEKKLNYAQLFMRKVQLQFQPQVAHEHLEGGEVGEHSDIYSFGVIFKKLFPEQVKLVAKLASREKKDRHEAFEDIAARIRYQFTAFKEEAVQECIKTYNKLRTSKYSKTDAAAVDFARKELDDFITVMGNAKINNPKSLEKVRVKYNGLKDAFKRIHYKPTNLWRRIAIILHIYAPPEERMKKWLEKRESTFLVAKMQQNPDKATPAKTETKIDTAPTIKAGKK